MNFKKSVLLILSFSILLSCERDLSDDAVLASFPKTGDVYTDTFVNMGSDFYLPFEGSKLTAFSIDNEEGYLSDSSIRIDVPNEVDPTGNYAGAIFRVDGVPRDLTGFNALTFWVKASRGVSIDAVGFGNDFLGDTYQVTANDVNADTSWSQVTIPIPDSSKLIQERGMFWYSMGTQNTAGSGYTVWFDEIKFENLGTIGQPRPAISNGEDVVTNSFTGVELQVNGLIETFNLGSGLDQVVTVAPSYYDFTASNPSVTAVDSFGNIAVTSAGTSVITATLADRNAAGSLTVNSQGVFQLPPAPTRDPSRVVSIFSDVYNDIPVDFFNGYWQPFQTTLSADFSVNSDQILGYSNFNFVGNQFSSPTIDATVYPNLHIDMFIPAQIEPDLDFLITIKDFGADQVDGGGDDTIQQVFFFASDFTANTWASFDIPVTMANRNNIGQIIYENINNPTTSSIESFYLDNIYFYN
ncbi:Ig-like domain-containing protein [Nonlabens sp.]|uniref:Ig-like domain-containing protein n=1 Tax=Nonlabens sp. TaxID=1888209 RepID=UPI003F6A3BDB